MKKHKTILVCLASFLAAALGMILIYYSDGIYPGSRRTMFVFDMRAQFSAFFASLRYIGKSDDPLFFACCYALMSYNMVYSVSLILLIIRAAASLPRRRRLSCRCPIANKRIYILPMLVL